MKIHKFGPANAGTAALAILFSGLAFGVPARAADVTVENARQIGAAIATALGTGAPFQATLTCSVIIQNLCWGPYAVPENLRLEIDYVSFECLTAGPFQLANFSIVTLGAGVQATHFVNLPLPPSSVAGEVEFGQAVKIYADAGSTITMYIGAASGTFDFPCTITFAGRQIGK